MRLFAGDRIKNIMERFKLPDDQPMEAKILSNQIEGAQKKVEEQNFVARKNVLKYDDVMNTQRVVIYEQRRRVLEGEDLSERRARLDRRGRRGATSHNATEGEFKEEWDLDALVQQMQALYGTDMTVEELRGGGRASSREALHRGVGGGRARSVRGEGGASSAPELMRESSATWCSQVVDQRWRGHLDGMDYLRDGMHLRAIAQKDPLVEYRAEGHAMFKELGNTIREEVVLTLFHAQVELGEQEALEPTAQGERQPPVRSTRPLPGAEAIAGAAAPAGGPAAGRARSRSQGGGHGTRPSTSTGRGPQRSLLVRERQEVQECHGA